MNDKDCPKCKAVMPKRARNYEGEPSGILDTETCSHCKEHCVSSFDFKLNNALGGFFWKKVSESKYKNLIIQMTNE